MTAPDYGFNDEIFPEPVLSEQDEIDIANGELLFDHEAKAIHDCKGGCGTKLLSPGRCVPCFMDWVSPPPERRAS